jgi:DNA-binding Lrp family transcriptional regulator
MAKRDAGEQHTQTGQLDAIDARILELLVADARLSTRAIAREVGMSPGAISDRVARLERAGVITGYHASLDISALGFPIVALIGLEVEHGRGPFSEMIDELMAVPSVRKVQVVTGEWDLLIEVTVRDHDELREVLLGDIWSIPGFRHSQTMMLLDVRRRPGFELWNGGSEPAGPDAS